MNGDIDNRLPNTSNISFGKIFEGEAILLMLGQVGHRWPVRVLRVLLAVWNHRMCCRALGLPFNYGAWLNSSFSFTLYDDKGKKSSTL